MSSQVLKFGIDLSAGKLHIVDLEDPTCRVEVDQVVFDATLLRGSRAEGFIVTVHGLPQEVADLIPAQMARQLGVAAHLRPNRGIHGAYRYRASAGDADFKRVTHP